MQEERRLLMSMYTKEEDIPSSATAITADNYSTVSGNVIYIPINSYEGPYIISAPYIYVKSYKGNKFYLDSIDIVQFTNDLYYVPANSTGHLIYMGYTKLYTSSGTLYKDYVIPYAVIPGTSNLQFAFVGGDTSALKIVYATIPQDVIYYSKIKYKDDITIGSVSLANVSSGVSFFDAFPIYIDTEE